MKPLNFVSLLGVSLALAGYSSWVASRREPAEPSSSRITVPAADIPLIRLAEARALWGQAGIVFLDVRSANDYEYGHVRGALSLPEEGTRVEHEQRLHALKPRLKQARVIVVYCKSRDCGLSLWAALRLRQGGLHQVRIYPNGWNEWVNRGMPVTLSDSPR